MRTWLVAVLLCAGSIALADDDLEGITDIEQIDLAELLGSVTAVSRREESVFTAPAAVTVLDQADIRASGATSIPDLLRRVPGVQVLETSPGNYLVSLRGTGGIVGNNLVVLLDGFPLNSAVDASVDWALVPVSPHQVERIEIVRGPVSTTYGTNAYTGVINIVSIAPSSRGTHATAHLEGGVDSRGRIYGSTSFGVGGTSGRWRWRVSGDASYDDHFTDGTDGTRQPALRKVAGTAFVEAQLRSNLTLSLRLAGGIGQHSSADQLVLESFPLTSTLGLAELRLRWKKPFSLVDSLELWGRAHSITEDTNPDLYQGFSRAGMQSADWAVGFDTHFKLPKGFTADLGADVGWSVVKAPYLDPAVSGSFYGHYGFYASAGVDIGKRLILTVATRGDGSSFLPSRVQSYRGSLIYRRTKWSLRLSAGTAYRTPSYIEVAGRFIDPATRLIVLEGTMGLQAPRAESLELGAIALLADRLTIRPTAYLQKLSNLIVEDFRSPTRKTFANDEASRLVFGGELEADLKLPHGISIDASFAGLYFLPVAHDVGPLPTIGVASQNSAITAYLGIRGSVLRERLRLALGALYMSSRSYDLRTGVPPTTLLLGVPSTVRLDGSASYKLTTRLPLFVYLKARAHVPHAVQESPIPGAARLGTDVVLGVEYRGE